MREEGKVSTDKSFNAYCGKENKEMGQVTRRGCGSRDGLTFFFLFQVKTILCLYADRNNLVEKEVWLEQELCPGRRDLVGMTLNWNMEREN